MKVVVKTLDSPSAFVFTGVDHRAGYDAGFILSDTILRVVGLEYCPLRDDLVPCTKYFPVARLVSITKTLEEGEVKK